MWSHASIRTPTQTRSKGEGKAYHTQGDAGRARVPFFAFSASCWTSGVGRNGGLGRQGPFRSTLSQGALLAWCRNGKFPQDRRAVWAQLRRAELKEKSRRKNRADRFCVLERRNANSEVRNASTEGGLGDVIGKVFGLTGDISLRDCGSGVAMEAGAWMGIRNHG